MAASYAQIKEEVLYILDEFRDQSLIPISIGYGTHYSAATKLDDIGVSANVRSVMPPEFNVRIKKIVGDGWTNVGFSELVACTTIGSLIILACGLAGVAVPSGEPT